MSVQNPKRKMTAREKGMLRCIERILTLTTFLLIFSVLLVASNWSAYSKIIADFFSSGKASVVEMKVPHIPPQNFSLPEAGSAVTTFPDLTVYPDDMRLEIPKVFSGSVPVQNVVIDKAFQFKDLYASTENSMQKALHDGVVHYPFTANPDQYGNVFITGHSSYYPWDKGRYKDIFALLYKLEKGDEYTLYFHGKAYHYRVQDSFEVQPEDMSVLEQPTDQRISTLMTCTPVGTVLRRLIVRGVLVN